MRPHVYLHVLTAGELLVAFLALEGALAGVHAHVIYEFVLGLKRIRGYTRDDQFFVVV